VAGPGPYYEGATLAVDRLLSEGDEIRFGYSSLVARRTPGHVPEEMCFEIVRDPRVLVGDTVFAGGPGHTETPEAFCETLGTLGSVVLSWSDDTICLPGHGEAFALGRIRADIERFLARDHGAFHGDAVWAS
jgi:glyoxylase-like metal-dependent hydrolase (beta-lactamase superfamily II)